jgi:hypothetical protein
VQEPQEPDDPQAPEPWPEQPRRPPPLRRAEAAAGRSWVRLTEAARGWDERMRTTSFVSASEQVRIDRRRHLCLLVVPALRTLAGVVALAAGLRLVPLLVFGLLVAVWASQRFRAGLRSTAVTAAAVTVALVVLGLVAGPLLCLLLLALWLIDDVADWYCDRLVVTDKRIYRRYGVLTQHSPSISLTAIAYIDASVPPVGRLVGYGTLSLDSVAQRDAPLSRFDLVPDVVPVVHEILELRSRAMPKFPQQPM